MPKQCPHGCPWQHQNNHWHYKNMKENHKHQSHYAYNIKVAGDYETLAIIQEENVKDRNAIKVSFFEERWRQPKHCIELLKKIIAVLEKDF